MKKINFILGFLIFSPFFLTAETLSSTDKKLTQTAQPINKTTKNKTKNISTKKIDLFSIGSGGIGGNYFLLSNLISSIVSKPYNSLSCEKGGGCGILGLQVLNISSKGSVDNLKKLQKNTIQSAFIQSGVTYWAYTGTEMFANKKKQDNLRAIASLYPEKMHILVRKDAQISTVADFVGKRISVSSRNSGTLIGARIILNAYKVTEDDMETEYLTVSEAMDKIKNNKIDGMFFSVGEPAPFLVELLKEGNKYKLLSIGKAEIKQILKKGHYILPATIEANVYNSISKIDTISVYALWVTTKTADKELIYKLTKALWQDSSKFLIKTSNLGGKIDVKTSLKGIGIPLHQGAKKYYNEIGKRF